MRQLLHRRWIRARVIGFCSSMPPADHSPFLARNPPS
jgi:hypothetical protein